MPRTISLRCIAWLVLTFILWGGNAPCAAGPDARDLTALEIMTSATKQSVKDTGVEAAGVGSWISQKKYQGPLSGGSSDHDMRVILTGEANPEVLTKKWREFQGTLKENITALGKAKGLSDAEINKLVSATNVYPPSQLMEGVENAADAQKAFAKYGAKPNLGGAPVEGLWGKGSKTYTHYYEEKAGKLFFVDSALGKVMTGGTDLTHMIEGAEAATTAGEVNKAGQWAEKVLEQLEAGDLPKVAKQAERLRTAINKGRGLERVGARMDYLDDIVSGTVTDPELIKDAVGRAQKEANLLLSLSQESNARNRELLKGILNESPGPLAKMRGAFWKYAAKVPVGQLLRAFQLYSYYARVKDVSAMSGADFDYAVRSSFAKELGWLAGPLAGLGTELADAVLTAARAGAYSVVTAFQECTNLVEGFHSVSGRQAVNPGMTVETMATTFPDTGEGRQRLLNFIWSQAAQAATREENQQWVMDPAIQNALYQKCANALVKQWQEKRLDMISEFNALFVQFDRMMQANKALLTVEPGELIPLQKPTGGAGRIAEATIRAGTSQDAGRIAELLKRMAAMVKALEAEKKDALFLSNRYALTVDSSQPLADSEPLKLRFTFKAPGDHLARLSHELTLTATVVSNDLETYTALGGYRKVYATTGSAEFSVVMPEESRARLRIAGPGRVKTGERFTLQATASETDVPASALRIAWANQGTGQRFGGFSDMLSGVESKPGTYYLMAELFMDRGGTLVKLADARHALVVEDVPKPDIKLLEIKWPEVKPPEVKKPDDKKPAAPPAQAKPPEQKNPPKPGVDPEKVRLCECVNAYISGPRTEEQRRSYDKWCTDKERCKGTEDVAVEPFTYKPDGDYCWGYEECREYSYDPVTKKASTRTCGSFRGAYYIYQAKEMCAKVKK